MRASESFLTTCIVTGVPITASVRIGTGLLCLAQGINYAVVKGVGALRCSGDVIYIGTLALRHLGRQFVDDIAGVARTAIRNGGGKDLATFNDHLCLDIAMTRSAP